MHFFKSEVLLLSLDNKRKKDFDKMSAEDKYIYAATWETYRQVVAVTVSSIMQRNYGIQSEDLNFELPLAEITNHNQEEAAHTILDIHEELDIKVDEVELKPYEVYDTLFDLVLVLSAELTDERLGYVSMFDEMEIQFG